MKLYVLLFFFISMVMTLDSPNGGGVVEDDGITLKADGNVDVVGCFSDRDCLSNINGPVCVQHKCTWPDQLNKGSQHLAKRAGLGQKCDDNKGCGQGLRCFYNFCIADSKELDEYICRENSNCKNDDVCINGLCHPPSIDKDTTIEAPDLSDAACYANCHGGYCYNGLCMAGPSPSKMRFVRRSPQLICHNDRECEGGYCYHGICVADPPRLELESRSPQLICHNDRECEGGYCYHGICVADPPRLEARSPQLICHNDRECEGGYCYHGICVADPPKLEARSPQLVCHNDRECEGGYCYHGICIADPPKLEAPSK
ncbi:hypothetical protein BJY04DRAFT_215251 [Aspergillus karnatakaensis]|uniref:uncharacterized protein n=1 Tax=Aspergillus karnatakaensis TaxID=1810916 RepID=UPI003CCDC97D